MAKSAVGFELHAQLAARGVRHCFIEGDNLDMAFPTPWEHGLAERNLAGMWANYRRLGYRRLILTNTTSVLFSEQYVAAMGDEPRVVGVLLRASDEVAEARLRGREIGSELELHIARS